MPNELPLPDDLQKLIEKRSGKDRRRRNDIRSDDDDVANRRAGTQRDRRQNKNYRDLLYDEDDE